MIKESSKKQLQIALKKSQGMLAKLSEMIEQDTYCVNIAQQVNATIGLLQGMNRELMKNHLACCGSTKLMHDHPEKEAFIEELVRTWDVTMRK